jgi:hypothetical protein
MASPRSTRQLLGELDALMDQMLSLPVDEGAAPSTPRIDPPHPVAPPNAAMHPLSVTMTLLEPSVEEPNVDEPIATPSIELPDSSEPADVDESFWVQEADLVPDPQPRPTPVRGRTALVSVRSEPLVTTPLPIARLPGRQIKRSYAWALRIDRFLIHRTFRLGIVGRLIRSDVGRTVLGVLGILMLLIAAGWLAKDLVHWT